MILEQQRSRSYGHVRFPAFRSLSPYERDSASSDFELENMQSYCDAIESRKGAVCWASRISPDIGAWETHSETATLEQRSKPRAIKGRPTKETILRYKSNFLCQCW